MFKNLKIGSKILILVLIILILMGIALGIAIFQMEKTGNKLQEMAKIDVPLNNLFNKIAYQQLKQSLQVQEASILGEQLAANNQQAKERFGKLSQEFEQIGKLDDEELEIAKNLIETAIADEQADVNKDFFLEFKRKMENLHELHENFDSDSRKIFALTEQQNYAEVKNYLLISQNRRNALENALEKMFREIQNFTQKNSAELHEKSEEIARLVSILSVLIFAVSLILGFLLTKNITKRLGKAVLVANKFAQGDENVRMEVQGKDELDELATSFNEMIFKISQAAQKIQQQNWLKNGQAELNKKIRGDLKIEELVQNVINFIVTYIDAKVGVVFVKTENEVFKMVGSYAFTRRKSFVSEVKVGESVVGQAILEKKTILIANVPENYIEISSGIGESVPKNLIVVPLIHENDVKGVIEIGTFSEISDIQINFLEQVSESIAITLNSAEAREKMKVLLEKTQVQAEELQTQQEELRVTNEELSEQARTLKESEERLQTQQEELRVTNEELSEKTKMLEKQSDDIKKKNLSLEETGKLLEEKAKDLEVTSKYKSEFLANMSHELRTPLNSLLILSKLLSQNKEKNLTEKQVEFAKTINTAGVDLLNLINEILDLSKVESGKMELHIEKVEIQNFEESMERNFRHVAEDKKLSFEVKISEDVPKSISTDALRVEQILKNFMSNALKFTEKGGITFSIYRPKNVSFKSNLNDENAIAFSVSDTGKGIAKDKQKIVFEAFQQEDGTTSRKYGGTGLGLSISRELAKILGGELQLESEEGKGSTFTVYLPESLNFVSKIRNEENVVQKIEAKQEVLTPKAEAKANNFGKEKFVSNKPLVHDDRENISKNDRTILIVEDDVKFARILLDLAHEKGFKCLAAEDGEIGVDLANAYKPSAIILDISLPKMDGWTVMEKLKQNPETRHIPVHFMSASDNAMNAMRMGAIGYLTKPVSMEKLDEAFSKIEETILRTIRRLLVVEDESKMRNSIIELIGRGEDVEIIAVESGEEAYKFLQKEIFDCMILDLGLNDISGFDLLEKIRKNTEISHIPIIIYTGKDLTKEEDEKLKRHAESIIIKGVKSPERLVDETTLFLHRVQANLPEQQKQMLKMVHNKEVHFKNKKVLLVDDDMRNIFALSNVLEDKEVKVVIAKNGIESLQKLEANPDIDIVLMDIMMPEMDGYEAMKEIRKQGKFAKLPIIALTAKAMKGDETKCIEAGASDYLAKPIDNDKLLSLMRVWLSQ
ncbi:response regulator [bacterium]|nr:response regulator [bacterium]